MAHCRALPGLRAGPRRAVRYRRAGTLRAAFTCRARRGGGGEVAPRRSAGAHACHPRAPDENELRQEKGAAPRGRSRKRHEAARRRILGCANGRRRGVNLGVTLAPAGTPEPACCIVPPGSYSGSGGSALSNKYLLKLYVAGTTPRAQLAIENLKRLCESDLSGRYDLEIIDVVEH